MRKAVQIRPAVETDVAALAAIYESVRAEIGEPATDGFLADSAGEVVLVAETGAGVAGFVSLWMPDSFVHHLYVSATHRHAGVGAALLQAGVNRLPGRAWLKVPEANRGARAFYARMGWIEDTPIGAAGEGVVIVRAPAGS